MHKDRLRTPFILSIFIVILATFTSIGGLLIKDLYRDNLFVNSAWKGNDLVTLTIAIPLLVVGMLSSRRGSTKGYLLWMGVLDYMLYNYAFYLFGASFNAFFLLYTILLSLAIFSLIFGLTNLRTVEFAHIPIGKFSQVWSSGYLLLVALGLTLIYASQSVSFILSGEIPAIVAKTNHPTSVIFALDLTLLVPFFALGAVLLILRKPWGSILAGMSVVKGPLYTLVLVSGSVVAAKNGVGGAINEVPFWAGLTSIGLISAGIFFLNLNTSLKNKL
jgi:hypothetical protein